MINFLKRQRTALIVSILLVLALIFIIVIVSVPKTKITQIPPNDERYCYDIKYLLDKENPTDYLNVTSVFSGDVDKSFTEVIASANKSDGNKEIIDHGTKDDINKYASNLVVDVANGELVGKIEIFCLSNIDDEDFRKSAIDIKIINEGGYIEVNFTMKELQFLSDDLGFRIDGGLLLQYLVRIK